MVTFDCSANFTATIMPEEAQETIDETPVNIARQSVPDENLGDEIVHGLDVLAEVKLPSTIRKSAHPYTKWHLNNYTIQNGNGHFPLQRGYLCNLNSQCSCGDSCTTSFIPIPQYHLIWSSLSLCQ
jgi:hypothetical protein